jgi:SPP1 family predicted phage head-tail adaptor
VKIGSLRRRIKLRSGGETQDPDTGVMTPGGALVAEGIPAAIEPLSGREFIASAATQAQVTTRITIRYRADVVETMTIEDDRGKVYTIEAPPLPDKKSGIEYLTLLCAESTGAGGA